MGATLTHPRDARQIGARARSTWSARRMRVGQRRIGYAPHMDSLRLDDTLSDEERELRDRVRAFGDDEVLPIINGYWERAEFPFELVGKLAELGIAGTVISGHGCPGMSARGAGVVARELARADGSINTF